MGEMLSVDDALCVFDHINELPLFDDFICTLQSSRKKKNLAYAKRVHAFICNHGLGAHRAVGNYIVPMFVECGSVSDAQQVFDKLSHRSEHSWTSLISGYAQSGQLWHALKLYQKMQEDSVRPSSYTLVALLKSCVRLKDVERGREIHVEIAQMGFERDPFVGSTLVDMYAKCGSLSESQEVFDKLPIQNVVTWNALMVGLVEHGPVQEALECFEQMQLEGTSPDAITFVCILKACGSMQAIGKGRDIHAEISRLGFERDLCIGNSLVDMYAKCCSLAEAPEVFDKLPVRDVVSWTTLIAGYAEHGPGQEALNCFEQMERAGVCPNAVTFVCVLKACGSMGAISKGREIHSAMPRKEFGNDISVGNTLVDMYAKCGSLPEAQLVFDKLPVRDVVSWTALIAGYAEHGPGQKALEYFEQMELEGVSANAVTFVCALKACGTIGAIGKGREVHTEILRKGFERNISVGNTLVNMYATCGSLSEAQDVLDKLRMRDVVSWTTIIKGCGLNYEINMAALCFEDMKEHGVKPDAVTFTSLLNACSHFNLLFKGQEYLNIMRNEYGIASTIEQYACMADLLARSGHLEEAEEFLEILCRPPSEEMWTALLSSCKTYGKADLGQTCFQELAQMNPESAASFVLIENIYASAGRWGNAYRVEKMRKYAGGKGIPQLI